MSRLDALVAALPKILPVVETIGDELFRDRVFDALVQAATDDAQTAAPVTAAPAGTIYGTSASRASGHDTATYNIQPQEPDQPALDTVGAITAPAIVDLDNGQRLTGTYTGDGQGGTFTPDLGLSPNLTGYIAPSDVPLHDEAARAHQRP